MILVDAELHAESRCAIYLEQHDGFMLFQEKVQLVTRGILLLYRSLNLFAMEWNGFYGECQAIWNRLSPILIC